jgi:hypothetical protein
MLQGFPSAAARRLAVALAAVTLTLAAVPAGAAEPSATPPPSHAAGAFDQLKALQGTWKGTNGKGHEETSTFRVIANGSVLEQREQETKDAAGKGLMSTMFQLDGNRLMATHFCGAGNAPRLVASGFDDAAHTVTFTYLDGVNLPSRDHGHMDKVVLHLVDANHFTAHWTWYEDGKENWLDEIRFERLP